jgi:hypothetical protein
MGWPTDFDGWIARVKKWLDVPDLDDDVFGFCIDSANERLNRDLNSQWMEEGYEFEVEDPSEPIDLASEIPDYNRMRLVTVRGFEPLHAKALNEFKAEQIKNTGTTPSVYCINKMQLFIWPLPTVGSIVDIDYYMSIPALSSTTKSNVFSKKHPDALLYASLLEATPFLVEDERLETWTTFYNNIREAINVTAERAKKGSTPLKREIKVA